MTSRQPPDADTVQRWLGNTGTDHYICDQCHGLHLPGIQDLDGVVESRLMMEEWGLLVSTEYLIRPTAILPLAADLGHLSASYPILKLFPDIVDDAMPQLVAGATQLTGAGLGESQFALFLATALEATTRLTTELGRLDYLLTEEPTEAPAGHRFH